MFSRRLLSVVVLFVMSAFVFGSVLADDGRINLAPYHFGGDTLYCNHTNGCTLLDKNGKELANWPQSDVADAFAAYDLSKANVLLAGDHTGTFGAVQLWAVGAEDIPGAHKLCLVGSDEWGKQNEMCFVVHADYVYDRAPVAVNIPSTDCSVNLGSFGFTSIDGIHTGTGWDVWSQNMGGFLYWTESDPGLNACALFA